MLLLRPEVHLRYSLETRFDYLPAGVKHFYIPDLDYWRYGPNPGYAKMDRRRADPAASRGLLAESCQRPQ